MKLALLFLVLTALIVCPAAGGIQSFAAAESNSGTGVKDSWITTKTKMALVSDNRVKARQIKVETQGAVVTLRGKVASGEERNAAEQITRGIDGVRAVRNTLEIVPETKREASDARDDKVAKAVSDRLDMDGQLKGTSVRVRADNGIVTLMGDVPNARAKERAVELARRVRGVRAVRNELQLKS
jgi:hyperosmotically inducible protein